MLAMGILFSLSTSMTTLEASWVHPVVHSSKQSLSLHNNIAKSQKSFNFVFCILYLYVKVTQDKISI